MKQKPSKKRRSYKKKKISEEKTDIYKITRRLYYLLRHHQDRIYFKKLSHGVYGYYDYGTEEITLDYRRDIIPTLIHESLHHWHPEWSETAVLKEEGRIMNLLTSRQIKNILKILGENVV